MIMEHTDPSHRAGADTGNVTPPVIGNGRRATIGMAEEDVAPLLPSSAKSQSYENPLDVSEGDNRKTTHRTN